MTDAGIDPGKLEEIVRGGTACCEVIIVRRGRRCGRRAWRRVRAACSGCRARYTRFVCRRCYRNLVRRRTGCTVCDSGLFLQEIL